MFKPSTLYYADGYKIAHNKMLAKGTVRLYGTEIPRTIKRAPEGITKIVSIGQQLTWRWLHDEFNENFFGETWQRANKFAEDMCKYIGLTYDGNHFMSLWIHGHLPIKAKALPEGIETNPNIPHMTFINTVDGFAWLTLYIETIVSALSWKTSTAATIALKYRRNLAEYVNKTDPSNAWFINYGCHDFASRGLDPFSMIATGIGHAASHMGSDELIVIPAARYFYNEPESDVCINSVNASEHSVTCTNIFYYETELKDGKLNDKIQEYCSFELPCDGSIDNPDYLAIAEWLTLKEWLLKFPDGILSYVCDTFNTWKSMTHIIPRLKDDVMNRNGKLVIRPDTGNPIDIICGTVKTVKHLNDNRCSKVIYKGDYYKDYSPSHPKYECDHQLDDDIQPFEKGVIELLWDTFGGTVNEQGYKVLDSHIGAIYGDSITLERQVNIYKRLKAKKFATTNIVLGIGSYTYQYVTRDTFGFAIKGAWFERIDENGDRKAYNIYKDPITGDGTKKSLKGLLAVHKDDHGDIYVKQECTKEEEEEGMLQTIYEDGEFYNQTTLTEIRQRINQIVGNE